MDIAITFDSKHPETARKSRGSPTRATEAFGRKYDAAVTNGIFTVRVALIKSVAKGRLLGGGRFVRTR